METSGSNTAVVVEPQVDVAIIIDPPGDSPAQDEGPCLSEKKAKPELKPLVRWLAKRSYEAKLTAVVVQELIRFGGHFKEVELYDGDIGNDAFTDCKEAVFIGNADPENLSQAEDTETAVIAGYIGMLTRMDV